MKKMKFLALLLGAVAMAGCQVLIGGGENEGPDAPVGGDLFSFEVSNITAYSATVKVTASDNLTTDWIWDVAEESDMINPAYVEAYLKDGYEWQLEYLEATESEYPYSKFLLDYSLKPGVADEYNFENALSAGTTYKVWACGLDMDGKAVDIKIFKFTTEALANDVKGNWGFSISSSSAGVTITVTPPSDLQTVWYWDVYEKDGYGVDASLVTSTLEYYLEYLVSAGELSANATMADLVSMIAIPAKQKDTYTFEPGDLYDGDYYVWACGLDAKGNVVTKIDYSEFTVSGSGSGSGSGGGYDDDYDTVNGTAKADEPYSNLTSNVSFTAEEAYMESYGDYWDGLGMSSLYNHENFYIELYGPYVGDDFDWIVLDLLAPAGASTPEGTYTVGYSGDYIALSSVYVDCGNEDDSFWAGSCYGFGNSETSPYSDFESGTVKITKSGSNYNIVVDAKCGAHTIKMTYTGALTTSTDIYGQSPKLKKFHTATAQRDTIGKERKVRR